MNEEVYNPILAGAGHLASAQDDAQIAAVRQRTATLNRHLALKVRSSNDIAFWPARCWVVVST